VRLQRLRDGGLSDVTVFRAAEGLRWMEGSRTRTFTDLDEWQGSRAQAGKTVPKGFPRSNRFGITGLNAS
jgi:topoisomerase-4 subunit A